LNWSGRSDVERAKLPKKRSWGSRENQIMWGGPKGLPLNFYPPNRLGAGGGEKSKVSRGGRGGGKLTKGREDLL